MYGSVKNKITAPELLKERQNIDFDRAEIKNIFWKDEKSKMIHDKATADVLNDPELALTHKFYEMTRQEKQTWLMKRANHLYFKSAEDRKVYFTDGNHPQFNWTWAHIGQSPIGLHGTMFV